MLIFLGLLIFLGSAKLKFAILQKLQDLQLVEIVGWDGGCFSLEGPWIFNFFRQKSPILKECEGR